MITNWFWDDFAWDFTELVFFASKQIDHWFSISSEVTDSGRNTDD